MPRAFKRPAKTLCGGGAHTNSANYLRQASPDRGKYRISKNLGKSQGTSVSDHNLLYVTVGPDSPVCRRCTDSVWLEQEYLERREI